ncbi:MAG: nitroreductase family protein [Propionibacteriaceae bacterium]|jgi:nitroreductase|nr:nitroreductase family protein [Propionibacteriaceae bacterium]
MDSVLDAIRRRYACRSFAADPVPPELLQKVVEAGLRAPSGRDRQPWRIIAVTNPERVAELETAGLEALRQLDPKGHADIVARGGRLLYGAPVVLLVARLDLPGKGTEIDTGVVVAHLLLAATELGLATCPNRMLGKLFQTDQGPDFERRLGFPEGFEYGLGILLGYAAEAPRQPHQPDFSKFIEIA